MTDEGQANAAFIVDCVNSHATLKARVEELTRLLREARRCCDPAGDPTRLTHAAMTAQIDAALSTQEAGKREYDPNVAPCDDAEFGMKP